MRLPLMSCDRCGEDIHLESEGGTLKFWSGRAIGFFPEKASD